MLLLALVERLLAHGLVTPSVASLSSVCVKLTHFVPASRSTSQGSSHQQRVLVINFPCGLLEPHYGAAWSSSMVDEDAVFLWMSRCVASRARNARCIRGIPSTLRPSCPRLRSLFVCVPRPRLCVCSPLCRGQAMLGGRWQQLAARGPPWPRCGPCVCVVWLVAVVQPPGDVETVSMLHGMSGQRPCRWRRAVDDTGHEGGSSAPGEGGRGRGVAVGGRGAGSLRPRGRSRRARSTFCVSHDVYQ